LALLVAADTVPHSAWIAGALAAEESRNQAAEAEQASFPPASAGPAQVPASPVPVGVEVSLETARKVYLLGENVLVNFVVRNTSATPFSIAVGGDYRSGIRHHRFSVTATDAAGSHMPDPDPSGFHMGGVGISRTVEPGKSVYLPVELFRYVRIEKPGAYTIRIRHDLGWTETPTGTKLPAAETKLAFKMPDEKQAAGIVAKLSEGEAQSLLMVSPEKFTEEIPPDSFTLCHPVFFPALTRLATTGKTSAIDCLGAIETSQATQALIDLVVDDAHPDASFHAARVLANRLPDPDFGASAGPKRGAPFKDPRLDQRKALSTATWQDGFAPRLHAPALRLLRSDAEHLAVGAFYLEAIAANEHLPAVLEALDRALAANQRTKYDKYLTPPIGVGPLLRAGCAIVRRGAPMLDQFQRPAVIALQLGRMQNEKNYRLDDWHTRCADLLGHERPYVRQLTLQLLADRAEPVPEPCLRQLGRLLEDQDAFVVCAALQLVARTKDAAHHKAVVKILTGANHEGLLYYAGHAAYALGARAELLEIYARRLDEPDRWYPGISQLIGLIESSNGGGSFGTPKPDSIRHAKQLWIEFLAKHRHAIRAGKKFALDEFDPAMAPPPTQIAHRDGETWPKR